MQILPLVTSSSQAAADGTQQSAAVASRQTARFASLLDKVRASMTAANGQTGVAQTGSTQTAAAQTGSLQTASSLSTDPVEAAGAPSQQELMQLLMTREDLADLHDDLVNQGFSEDEITALGEKIDSPTGMTWGEMMGAVKKKIAKTTSSEKKEVSNDDTVQLLGLFGKLGFTADQSQKMVDALANGQTDSVMAAVDAKVANLAADDTVSLTSTEMTTLGRVMNLSEAAQKRLTALFDQSDAASGLSGQGLSTAFGLVKNEILAQLGQENQSMAQFRQAASVVLDKAWQRQEDKLNSDKHQDDVARKAAQVVAMGGEKKTKTAVPTASQPGIDVLADVPEAGTSPLAQDAAAAASVANDEAQDGSSGSAKPSATTAERHATSRSDAQTSAAAAQAAAQTTSPASPAVLEALAELAAKRQATPTQTADTTDAATAQSGQQTAAAADRIVRDDLAGNPVSRQAAQAQADGASVHTGQTTAPGIDLSSPEALADAASFRPTLVLPQAAAAGQGAQAATVVRTDGAGVQTAGSELQGRASVVAAEQAAAWGQAATAGQTAQDSTDGAQELHREVAAHAAQRTQTATTQNATAVTAPSQAGDAGGNAGGFASGQQNGGAGSAFGHDGQEAGLETLSAKARQEKTAGRSSATTQSDVFQGLGLTDATTVSRAASAARTSDPALASRVARQLESGILRNVGQDAKQLTVTLTPEDLGSLDVTLTVKDKEVRAVIKADNPDTAAMLADQSAHIRKTLEDQGFKVTKFDVQSGIAQDNQSAWQSPEQHNQAREQREAMDRMRTSQRLVREGSLSLGADSLRVIPQAASAGNDRLDLFA
jgi:flagellar hook-length control protein FliK